MRGDCWNRFPIAYAVTALACTEFLFALNALISQCNANISMISAIHGIRVGMLIAFFGMCVPYIRRRIYVLIQNACQGS